MKRRLWFSLATVLIVVGIIGSLFTFENNKEEVSKEETISNKNVDQMDIYGSNAKIDVRSTTENDIFVALTGTKSVNNQENLNVKIDDHALKIDLGGRKWRLFDIDSIFNDMTLTIHVPEKQYDALHVNSGNGDITAKEIDADDVELETSNGRVTGEDLKSSAFSAHTKNGKVTLKDVDGTITGETANGKITIDTPDLERSIDLKTANGAITIHSENEPENVSMIANTSNGGIDIFGQSDGYVVGDGEHTVQLHTANGPINVSH